MSFSKGDQEIRKGENQKCRLSPEGGLAFHDAAVSEKLQEKRERKIQQEELLGFL